MNRNITEAFKAWLASGFEQMGEIIIRESGSRYELTHFEDLAKVELLIHSDPGEARQLALYDDNGAYRPLKTAPNLRHGWKLSLPDIASVRLALDAFYPAMLGTLLSHHRDQLIPVPLRETLARQSGMYAVTKRLTDSQADAMIGGFCTSKRGCLKTILWRITSEKMIDALPAAKFDPAANQLDTQNKMLPMLCPEACNLLVAKAREIVKESAVAE